MSEDKTENEKPEKSKMYRRGDLAYMTETVVKGIVALAINPLFFVLIFILGMFFLEPDSEKNTIEARKECAKTEKTVEECRELFPLQSEKPNIFNRD